MKKIIAFLLCTLLLVCAVYPAVSAEYDERLDFDDGSYIIFSDKPVRVPSSGSDDIVGSDEDFQDTVEESAPSALTRLIRWFKELLDKIFAKQSTVTKTKYCHYFSSDDYLLWSVSLKGNFTYNHRKAVCVSSEIDYEIRDNDWKILSFSSTEDGSTATGVFAIRQYKLGIPLKTIEKMLTLTCDKNGNIT